MWFNWKATILMALNDDDRLAVIQQNTFTFSVYWCAQKDIKRTHTHISFLFCLFKPKSNDVCLSAWVTACFRDDIVWSTAFHTTKIRSTYLCNLLNGVGIKRWGAGTELWLSKAITATHNHISHSKRLAVIIYLFFDLTDPCAVVCAVLPTSFSRNRIFYL